MSSARLKELEHRLRGAGFVADVLPVGEQLPVEQLLVHLGKDGQERDLALQLLFLSDLQRAAPDMPQPGQTGDTDYLQFYVTLPFEPVPAAFPGLARLILSLNWGMPIGGFGLSEAERVVFCRHVLFCPAGRVDADLTVKTIRLMAFYVMDAGLVLEAVGRGDRTLDEVVAESEVPEKAQAEYV